MSDAPDAIILRLAARQLGVVTAIDAAAAGLTQDQLDRRVARGLLLRPTRGVYVAAGMPPTPARDALVAYLAGPSGTCASHATAVALFGAGPFPPVPHVTVPAAASARSRVGIAHRSDLAPLDRTRVGLVPCTSPARTLVDIAAVVDMRRLEEVVDTFLDRGLTSRDAALAAAARASARPGRPGLRALRAALEAWAPGIAHDSPAEARLLRLVGAWDLPAPRCLHVVRDGDFVAELDLAWPEHLVALEYDGSLVHGPRAWARDEARVAHLARLGWGLRVVTKSDLHPGREHLLRADLTRLLRLGSAA